jgi:phage gp16-like protein
MQQDRLHDAPRTLRRPLIARVHMARKELALSEDSYRAVLARITGRHSAADLTVPQLLAVITEFERLGLRPRRVRSDKPHVRKIYALWGAMRPHLTDPSRTALRAFVARQTGVGDPEWLTAAQAARVTEALKSWRRREEARHAAAG